MFLELWMNDWVGTKTLSTVELLIILSIIRSVDRKHFFLKEKIKFKYFDFCFFWILDSPQ